MEYVLIFLATIVTSFSVAFEVVGKYNGDVILAAFFPIHAKSSNLKESRLNSKIVKNHAQNCGGLQTEDGIQFLEMLYFSLDEINRDPTLLDGIRLGAVVFDTCDMESHALEQAVELLRFLMTRSTLDDYPFVCKDGSPPSISPELEKYHNVIGVLGGSSSGVSIQLASVLRLFEVPQVSYLSTSPDLSHADRYPFFKRVVPSDNTQVRVMVEILKEFNWTYASVIYDDTNYGTKGYEELAKVAAMSGICFAYTKKLETENSDWSPADYDNIMRDLTKKDMKSTVAILYTTGTQARLLFQAAARTQLGHNITWVGGDAWSGRSSVTQGLEMHVHKAITVQPLAFQYPAFDDYYTGLHPEYNARDPWFHEFWEMKFNCTLAELQISSVTDYIEAMFRVKSGTIFRKHISRCTGEEQISPTNGYKQQRNVHFVRDATFAYAHAFETMHHDFCGPGHVGLCNGVDPGRSNLTGQQILDYLDHVHFLSASGRNFSFVNHRDGPPRYTIKTFRNDLHVTDNHWVIIGNYSGVSGEQGFSFEPFFYEWMKEYPESVCSKACGVGQIRRYLPGDECCWICTNCTEFQIALPIVNLCFICPEGYKPDLNRSMCRRIPETTMSHHSPWAIGAMAFSGVGMLVTSAVLTVFIRFQHTPIVKASGRELSYYLLAGICLSYIATFIFVARPSAGICAVSRMLIGLCYTVIYAAILTKTNRIARIFNESSGSPKKARYTSPKSQLIIANLMVVVELIIVACWLAAAPPRTRNIYPTRHDNILVCDGSQDVRYLIPLVYPLMLLICCAVYAFKTRKTPDGFNETRLIGFTSYTTGLIWLAFIPLYFITTNYSLKAFTMSIAIALNATVALACVFMPKVYICLLRPEKNTREAVMARSISVTSGTVFMEPGIDLQKTFTSGTHPDENSVPGPKKRIQETQAAIECKSTIPVERKENIYSITPTRTSVEALATNTDNQVSVTTDTTAQTEYPVYSSSTDPIVSAVADSDVEIDFRDSPKGSIRRASTCQRPDKIHEPSPLPTSMRIKSSIHAKSNGTRRSST